MVPELISHDTERRLCEIAGDTTSRFAEVLSFSRLAQRVGESAGHGVGACLDNGGRLAAMASAARQLHGQLKSYAAVETRPEFLCGLIDAIDKFDMDKNVKFETYASLRIRGAILDQIRKMDWIPRTVRQRQRKIDEAIKSVEMRTGKAATDEEIAIELGISGDELLGWQSQLKVTNVVSLSEFEEAGQEPVFESANRNRFAQPEEVVEEQELKQKLIEALDMLTEKERRVIELYYYEDLTLKEISLVLEVSESRVSQLHTKALVKMRKKMGAYMDILMD